MGFFIIFFSIMIITVIVSLVSAAVLLIIKECGKNSIKTTKPQEKNVYRKISYKRKELITPREQKFYEIIKREADERNLHVLSKVRVADIVEPISSDRKEWYSLFGRIKSKHVDFVLANPVTLYPLLLIEIDDSTHNAKNRKERDEFIDEVYEQAGINIAHIWEYNEIKAEIERFFPVQKTEPLT